MRNRRGSFLTILVLTVKLKIWRAETNNFLSTNNKLKTKKSDTHFLKFQTDQKAIFLRTSQNTFSYSRVEIVLPAYRAWNVVDKMKKSQKRTEIYLKSEYPDTMRVRLQTRYSVAGAEAIIMCYVQSAEI